MEMSANAMPTKRFFIDNLTRDLTLEDTILDLVDNSIDAFVRKNDLDVSAALLRREAPANPGERPPQIVSIRISDDEFTIEDKSGGIDLEQAQHFVFRFGRPEGAHPTFLGVYGIGLKRAVFKIGRSVVIESRTTKTGFRIEIDVEEWGREDTAWEFPMTKVHPARNEQEAGTNITVRALNPEVSLRMKDPTLLTRLSNAIAATYSLFLSHYLTVTLNGERVNPDPLPIGMSDEITPAYKSLTIGDVAVELVAGLAARKQGEWKTERAGWYVLCNGRVVVSADKTSLTGWGVYNPAFHSKYRGFVGIAFFFSPNPTLLPWTTTKRGLNLESQAYQLVRNEMMTISRLVLSFLNEMYPSEPEEGIEERDMVDKLTPAHVHEVVTRQPTEFKTRPKLARQPRILTKVQYSVPIADLERIRKRFNRPGWSAADIGRHTFEYFLRMEVVE